MNTRHHPGEQARCTVTPIFDVAQIALLNTDHAEILQFAGAATEENYVQDNFSSNRWVTLCGKSGHGSG
jgi:hypothetical protein